MAFDICREKKLYGDAARILPRHRPICDQELENTGAQRVPFVRKDGDVEPVCYNAHHRHVLEEIVHQVGGKKIHCIIDLTATEPSLAMVALDWNIPYLGVVFNEFHKEKIKQRLGQLVFQKFLDPKSSMHVPGLPDLMALPKSKRAADEHEAGGKSSSSNPKKKPKAKAGKNDSDLRAALLGQLAGEGDGLVDQVEVQVDDDE